MATKDLARTVIEGGRSSFNRFDRRLSNAEVRAAWRVTQAMIMQSADADGVLYPLRRHVYRDFHDKLAPAERWLARQVGRPWNAVRSDLFARFDARTTAGHHILFDHLLADVNLGDPARDRWADFFVDAQGILRRARERHRYRARFVPLPEPKRVLEEWLAGRRIGERAPKLYWFVRTPTGRFRQHHALKDCETARFRDLPEWYRRELDVFLNPVWTE